MVQRRMALAQWLLNLINTCMSINSSVSPFSCHSVLICLFILLHVSLSVCVCPFFYMFLFSLSFFFCCNFFRSYFSSSVNSSTSPFCLLSVFRPVCSYACPFAQSPVDLYPFFCRPTFDYRSVILLVDLFVRPSISPSVSLPVNLFVLFFIFLFVHSITRLLFLLSSRSSNLSRLCPSVSLYFSPSVYFLDS